MIFTGVIGLIGTCATLGYNGCKDLTLYRVRRRREFKDLETRIRDLITHLIDIESRKKKIDDHILNYSGILEENGNYKQMDKNIKYIHSKCNELIEEYTSKITGKPSSTTEVEAASAVPSVINKLDEFQLLVIEEVKNLKRKRLSFKFLKLAKLSRDIERLNEKATSVLETFTPEKMTAKKPAKANQKKVNDDLPGVFEEYVDEIIKCLCDNRMTVGVFGTLGAGKTTVMKKLFNKLVENPLLCGGDDELDFVIWAVCEPEPETEKTTVDKLQKEIMRQLNIDDQRTSSVPGNAEKISAFLRDRKYIMLIDQVTSEFNLDDVGLTVEHKNMKKVVIASSVAHVIKKMTEHQVEISKLQEENARKLFNKSYGKTVPAGELMRIAHRIIELCDGLPLLIDQMGKYFRGKEENADLWNGVKNSLQSENTIQIMELGVINKIYQKIYENLDTDSKKCSLYGALFPSLNKIYTDYLIECWIAQGFVNLNGAPKVKCGREVARKILNELTEHNLLRWCSDKQYMEMPMVFRKVASTLAYPGETEVATWVSSNNGDTTPNEDWTNYRRMSLIGCDKQLPESPRCCEIYTLLLQSKPCLETLSDKFFDNMQNLQVLDLNNTELRALPTSISNLVELKSLYLNDCKHLDTLPPEAEKLKKLEFLDICGTSIPSLPQEIKHMVNLRCLRVSFSPRRSNPGIKEKENREDLESIIIPPGIISSLTKLEELSINAAFNCESGIAVAKEMASLKYLTTLRFNFPDVSSVNTFVDENKILRSFRVSIGSQKTRHRDESEFSGIRPERWLRYSTDEQFSEACNALLKQANDFEIAGYNHGVQSLSDSIFELHELRCCAVEGCNNLKNIVQEGRLEGRLLENLEKLYLYDLQSLKCICDGVAPSGILTNLTTLTLNNCPELTKILDPGFARNLQSLKYLHVENCCNISHIVEDASSDNLGQERHGKTPEIVEVPADESSNEVLRSLTTMKLSNLPSLQGICRSSSISLKSMTTITITRCTSLRNLSLSTRNAKKLRPSIVCEDIIWNALDQSEKNCLHRVIFTEEHEPEAWPEGDPSSSGRSYCNGEKKPTINVDNGAEIQEDDRRVDSGLCMREESYMMPPTPHIR